MSPTCGTHWQLTEENNKKVDTVINWVTLSQFFKYKGDIEQNLNLRYTLHIRSKHRIQIEHLALNQKIKRLRIKPKLTNAREFGKF